MYRAIYVSICGCNRDSERIRVEGGKRYVGRSLIMSDRARDIKDNYGLY